MRPFLQLAGALCIACSACGGGAPPLPPLRETQPPSTPAPSSPTSRAAEPCRAETLRSDPLIVAWRPEARSNLELLMREGLALVRYDCTHFSLVTDCNVQGTYGYVAEGKKTDALNVEGIEGTLVSVGKRSTTKERVQRAELRGDCGGVTHFVRRATVGAFLVSGEVASASSTRIDVLGGSLVASSSSSTTVNVRDGDLTSCDSATKGAPPPQCSSPFRLELVPIDGR